jgi:hypothetical protein
MKFFWSILGAALISFAGASTGHAYIPEYSLLTSHSSDQHGKGSYLIEQEVTYRKEAETYTVKETWLVTNENRMRVTLEGRGPLKGLVQGTILYTGTHKFFFDSTMPGLRQQRLADEWLEPLFHFRTSKYLRSRLVTLNVAPPESQHERPALSSDEDPKYEPPSFLRLSRVGGTTAWLIGTGAGQRPALWLEQDQFVLRKYRSASQVLLHANDYVKFDDGFWFPRQRVYNFGTYNIEVQTLQVRSLGKLKPDDARFRTATLNAARDSVRLPETPALKEFFSRFR